MKLGFFKSINESVTRVAVYVSLMALYCLGGSKVKAVSMFTCSTFFSLSLTWYINILHMSQTKSPPFHFGKSKLRVTSSVDIFFGDIFSRGSGLAY